MFIVVGTSQDASWCNCCNWYKRNIQQHLHHTNLLEAQIISIWQNVYRVIGWIPDIFIFIFIFIDKKKKIIVKLRYPDLSINWREIYYLLFKVTLETKIREFQYKLLNHILFTSEKYYFVSKWWFHCVAPIVKQKLKLWSIYFLIVK